MLFYSVFLNLFCIALGASTRGATDKYVVRNYKDQASALQFLDDSNHQFLKIRSDLTKANWNFYTNLTEANRDEMLKMTQVQANILKEMGKNATSYAWKDLKDTNKTAYTLFEALVSIENDTLPVEKLEEFQRIVADMLDIHSKAKVCVFTASSDASCDLSSELELNEICAGSRNETELSHVWSQWRDATGKKLKDKFLQYVEMSKEVAKFNGYSDFGKMWINEYKSETFKEDVEELWQTLKPLFEQLHAYVRQKLRKQYPCSGIKADGPIPANLLGNMHGIVWDLFDIVSPYPGKQSTADVTKIMKEKNMTPLDMFKLSEEFFTSLGLSEMTPEFWHRSIIEKPSDREIVCHPSAWDFSDGKDFRIKMCTKVNMDHLLTIHHEMGHIEYFMEYAKQPAVYHESANPGFHEAIGDTIALSVATPGHLKKIGLLEEVLDDKEADINTLLESALDKVVSISSTYVMDAWRWKVFDGSISKEELNQKWWEMKLHYQGICPPVRRSNGDFDAGSMHHVAANSPYISYFVATVVQFQFHKALCDAAGHQGPLHKCDIYNSKEAGKVLSDMLSKGSSEPWEEAMSAITNGKSRKMDATAMIEFYKPLIDWLEEQNKNETLGWKSSDPMICP